MGGLEGVKSERREGIDVRPTGFGWRRRVGVGGDGLFRMEAPTVVRLGGEVWLLAGEVVGRGDGGRTPISWLER